MRITEYKGGSFEVFQCNVSGWRTSKPCQLLIFNTATSEKSGRNRGQLESRSSHVAIRQYGS